MSQEVLAELVGVASNHLALVERGERKLSPKLSAQLEDVFVLFEHDNPMDVMYDYVRVRFPLLAPGTDDLPKVQANAKEIIEGVIGIRFEAWLDESIKRYHYDGMYAFGDFHVLYPHSENEHMGILLELKGRGCRQLESIMQEQGRTWRDFFRDCFNYAPVFKRLDIAINDHVGILSVPQLIEKCEQDAFDLLHMRTYRVYKSGVPLRGETLDEKPPMACTLYLGSPRKSLIYFCVYEKDRELQAKEGIDLWDAETKNRFEVRLADDRADLAVQEILARDNVETVALDIIDQYVTFWASPDQPDKVCPRWAQFIGVGRRRVHLTMRPEPYTPERTKRWIKKQVMPSIKFLQALDQVNGTNDLNEMYAQAKLGDNQAKTLEQMGTPMDEMIVPAFLDRKTHPPAQQKRDEGGFVETKMKPGEVLMIQQKSI